MNDQQDRFRLEPCHYHGNNDALTLKATSGRASTAIMNPAVAVYGNFPISCNP